MAAFGHVGAGEAGGDRVDGDAVGAEFEREPAGEHVHLRLGGGVEMVAGEARGGEGGDRGDVDDAAIAGRLHAGQHGTGGVDGAIHIDRAQAGEAGGLKAFQRGRPGDAGIVDQDGDRAEFGRHLGCHRLHRRGIRHVGAHGDGAAAGGMDLGHQGRRRVGAGGVVDRNRRTFRGQRAADGAAEAAGAASDQGDLIGPVMGHDRGSCYCAAAARNGTGAWVMRLGASVTA